MKKSILLLTLALFPLTAAAGFNPDAAFECRATDGRKILVNDEFAGQGHARVSNLNGSFFARAARNEKTSALTIGISRGLRAWTNDLNIQLDLENSAVTSRQEGSTLVRYYYVPAVVEVPSAWSGSEFADAKCFQEI